MYPEAEIPKFFGRLTTVCEAVEDNPDTCSVECFKFVKDVDYSAIIGWIRDIECDDMQKRTGHGNIVLSK